ncbi:hypothetical protein O0L34_g1430 [Tuta absoluta]|nr:hypothetical protein O0L34_g1430 [Tuta absoluta]
MRHAQDSTGSVMLVDDDSDEDSPESTLLADVIAAVIEFFQVLVRSSYIATTITMMAWSILYHSWLTFVFLMWANIVWLCQNQRRFMLQTSPVLVLYAMVLLVVQYIYGMSLTEQELPSNITDVNLNQIGLGRQGGVGEAFVPLLIKSMFTCMFWVTLRQRVQEARARRQASALADMAAPLQVTVSTAASVIEAQKQEESKSRILTAVGDFLRHACARYWIYVVAIMLFVIGITGERMTIFRIIYMFLFLAFIILFQISWYWWRRLMYIFWIVVIIYSMINLILLYVYQFDDFSKIIERFLFINVKLQHDLGLEKYTPADLFVKLLTPTLFLIITIMQVHYFHKDFMQLSDYKTGTNTNKDAESSRPSQGASTIKDDIPQLPEDERQPSPVLSDAPASPAFSLNTASRTKLQYRPSLSRSYGVTSLRASVKFRPWLLENWNIFRVQAIRVFDCMFEYLDIHLTTIIFVALMVLCVFNVCAMHVPIMVLSCLALVMKRGNQRFCVLIISCLISVYFMAKMVYQIDYISHDYFRVNCTDDQNPINASNAEWLGFTKQNTHKDGIRLVTILKGYICLIALFTFNSLVKYRQQIRRKEQNIDDNNANLMFPDITREKADIDLIHCIKYLVNYGFYKFGVEITMICMIGVIGSRMDMYSVVYSIWLLFLVSTKRPTHQKIWTVFVIFLTIVVPLQYMIVVGFLPQFCITYPWGGSDEQMKHVRNWVFLPYASEPPHAAKLIFDYFLLLFATLQWRVFEIEKTHGEHYPGGSNSENVGHDWETPSFENPVPDFLGFVGTWLDIVKRMVFLGMLWVTLAIMFMTGTNRVNLFSLGYLVGSFVFLWQGTDFYLLPKQSILRWWSWLLRYNVSVVVIKALLQIPGCIFSDLMNKHACWLVQLLGIGCVDKFAGGSISKFLKMDTTMLGMKTSCAVPQEDIGLAWDGVCFAFLILQRRLFLSYYFYRVIDESKATTVLASRGAELIEELRMKQMKLQEEQELNILEKIKVKMEKIKANQRKVQGAVAKEPPHHDAEDDDEDTQHVESERVPLVRGDSDASARGYHTPEPETPTSPQSPKGFHTPLSEPSAPSSPARTPPPKTPRPSPLPILPAPSSHGGPPSPSSALLTSLSLDAYLEPRRISFESPPSSDLLPRAQSPEESYPVFSPPPIRRRHTVASPSLLQRTSVISQSSRSEPKSHQTSRECPPYKPPASHQKAVRSGDYYMFDDFDDTEEPMQEVKEAPDVEGPREMGLGKLVSTVFKTDLKRALSLRRASMPSVQMQRRLSAGVHSYALETRSLARSHTTAEAGPERSGAGAGGRPDDGDDDAADTMLEDFAPTPDDDTWFDKIRRVFEAVWAFVSSFLVSLTRHLMKYSRDYRYVSRTLTLEKKVLKEKEGFGIGLREGSQMRWEPLPETIVIGRKLSDISVPEIRLIAPSMERGLDASPTPSRCSRRHTPSLPSSRSSRSSRSPSPSDDDGDTTSEHESAFSLQTTGSKDVSLLEEHDDSMFKQDRSVFVHLIFAIWYAVLAHTDIVCYIMVFINQIQSATILSIPLPLMVFLWGTLTIPRPTKTFWVTLIAYTEVIVLIKSMFQFEILPWNQNAIPANMPFTAPRIIGIERKNNYALYDLLLLLIIFLHRFMLKSLGLWKETTPEIELREDMEFVLDPEDTQKLVEGQGEQVGQKYLQAHDVTGPRHRLVDRLRHVQATIEAAMRDLEATRSDPRVVHLVHLRLLRMRAAARRHRSRRLWRVAAAKATGRRLSQEPLLNAIEAFQSPARSATSLEPDVEWSKTSTESQRALDTPNLRNECPGPSRPPPPPDDHFKVNDDQEPIIGVTTTIEDPYEHFPGIIWLSVKRYLHPTVTFFQRMTGHGARVTADVYAYMFLCDFVNFLVVIFGFAAFGTQQGDGGVTAYLEENKVPIPFLVMLLLQFVLIVVDRALYLRKYMLGKILFQYALIIGVHIWMFFILPFITERTFNSLAPPPMWYMMKCVYLLLSAYQIRCGYPRRIIGNFLCKSYRFLNMLSFRCFMAVPFVFELRTLMDWIWTDTSMTLMDWLKMEDIFANVYLLKCSRYVDDEFPSERGSKKSKTSKYLLGGTVLAFVIAIIWFPLVFFAFGNTVGQPNPPTDVTVKIRIGPFLPVYQMSAQSKDIEL